MQPPTKKRKLHLPPQISRRKSSSWTQWTPGRQDDRSLAAVLRVLVGVPFEHQLPVGLFDGRLKHISSGGWAALVFSRASSQKIPPKKKESQEYQNKDHLWFFWVVITSIFQTNMSHMCFVFPFLLHLPSGNLTVCYWKWPFILDFSIHHGGSTEFCGCLNCLPEPIFPQHPHHPSKRRPHPRGHLRAPGLRSNWRCPWRRRLEAVTHPMTPPDVRRCPNSPGLATLRRGFNIYGRVDLYAFCHRN